MGDTKGLSNEAIVGIAVGVSGFIVGFVKLVAVFLSSRDKDNGHDVEMQNRPATDDVRRD